MTIPLVVSAGGCRFDGTAGVFHGGIATPVGGAIGSLVGVCFGGLGGDGGDCGGGGAIGVFGGEDVGGCLGGGCGDGGCCRGIVVGDFDGIVIVVVIIAGSGGGGSSGRAGIEGCPGGGRRGKGSRSIRVRGTGVVEGGEDGGASGSRVEIVISHGDIPTHPPLTTTTTSSGTTSMTRQTPPSTQAGHTLRNTLRNRVRIPILIPSIIETATPTNPLPSPSCLRRRLRL
mmetsp:Transcript_23908/g.43957  ORF Transcript_23908/g.43957 Transcript_23908/m.43957 type:complete len:229 (+) Transcript_23908:984-1670(+)